MYTQEIMKILGISASKAVEVQTEMEIAGFDFSQSSDRMFKREVKNTWKYLYG